MGSSALSAERPLKILMLHGYTQSGPLFRAKTRALEKNLQKAFPAGVSLTYPTAPIRLSAADLPDNTSADPSSSTSTSTSASAPASSASSSSEPPDAYAWFRRSGTHESSYVYTGLDTGLSFLASVLRADGPFDGVIGFSQGGAAAMMLASLLEPGRAEAFARARREDDGGSEEEEGVGIAFPSAFAAAETAAAATGGGAAEEEGRRRRHAPLKFAVSYSGFAPRGNRRYRAFYAPKIATPTLHFLGSLDTVVEEGRSLALADACEGDREGKVVYHPGGHFLPSSQKQYVATLVGFIREVMARTEQGAKEKEEAVEDMDVPF